MDRINDPEIHQVRRASKNLCAWERGLLAKLLRLDLRGRVLSRRDQARLAFPCRRANEPSIEPGTSCRSPDVAHEVQAAHCSSTRSQAPGRAAGRGALWPY